jgi:hypothetical protein
VGELDLKLKRREILRSAQDDGNGKATTTAKATATATATAKPKAIRPLRVPYFPLSSDGGGYKS